MEGTEPVFFMKDIKELVQTEKAGAGGEADPGVVRDNAADVSPGLALVEAGLFVLTEPDIVGDEKGGHARGQLKIR